MMLVGSAQGGVTAAEIAADRQLAGFVVDQVVTAGAPSAQVPRIPDGHAGAVAGGPRRPGGPAGLADQRRRRPTG